MEVAITIPQNIIDTCKECGWEEQEIAVLFKKYLVAIFEGPYGNFEQDFQIWLEDLNEEEMEEELKNNEEEVHEDDKLIPGTLYFFDIVKDEWGVFKRYNEQGHLCFKAFKNLTYKITDGEVRFSSEPGMLWTVCK
jgi:hypothetical protein